MVFGNFAEQVVILNQMFTVQFPVIVVVVYVASSQVSKDEHKPRIVFCADQRRSKRRHTIPQHHTIPIAPPSTPPTHRDWTFALLPDTCPSTKTTTAGLWLGLGGYCYGHGQLSLASPGVVKSSTSFAAAWTRHYSYFHGPQLR